MSSWGRLYSRYLKGSCFPPWLVLVLVVLCLLNFGRILRVDFSEHTPTDFRPLYLGQHLLLQGENPYDYPLLIETWKELAKREGFRSTTRPLYLVYPPWALALFTVFAPFSYSTAFLLWYGMIPLFLMIALYSCLRFAPGRFSGIHLWEAALLVLAFKGTIQSMIVGQPTFLCLALGFMSLAFFRRGSDILAGVMLGLAAFKISLAAPFIIFFMLMKKFKTVAAGMATGAILVSITLILSPNPVHLFTEFLRATGVVNRYSINPGRPSYPLTFDMTTKTELGTLLEFLFSGIAAYLPLIYIALIGVVVVFCLRLFKNKKPTQLFVFLLLALMSLLTTHHFHYDCLVLLPFYAVVLTLERTHRGLLLVLSGALFVPVNGILNRLPTPPVLDILYFTAPMTVAALTIFLLWRAKKEEGSLTMSPQSPQSSQRRFL